MKLFHLTMSLKAVVIFLIKIGLKKVQFLRLKIKVLVEVVGLLVLQVLLKVLTSFMELKLWNYIVNKCSLIALKNAVDVEVD